LLQNGFLKAFLSSLLMGFGSGGVLYADDCADQVLLFTTGSSVLPTASLEEIKGQLTVLYAQALNTPSLLSVFGRLLEELSQREAINQETLFSEIERRASVLGEYVAETRRRRKEEVEENRRREVEALSAYLEPYLEGLTADDRKEVEDKLIKPRLVNPRCTQEVEFRFDAPVAFTWGNDMADGFFEMNRHDDVFGPESGFAVGEVPVTQLLYLLSCLGDKSVDPTPSHWKTGPGSVTLRLSGIDYTLLPNHPVEQVSFDAAAAHARRVSRILGGNYALPLEREWQFAHSAGSTDRFHFGNNESELRNYAWYEVNSGERLQAVGELRPNAFGLYDTHGNVWEIVVSPDTTLPYASKGGGWKSRASELRTSMRYVLPDARMSDGLWGFRLVRHGSPGRVLPSKVWTWEKGKLR
jgi:hypothetical protein